ncbi:Ig-like domain-containing protein [Actinoplanes sp. NPDC026623]|uniref:Ig-like domain-containing protein n=1 Tax=Actinoplanes sp. NPDC026623 TaxID=3155610 RepID=UPI0033FB28AE
MRRVRAAVVAATVGALIAAGANPAAAAEGGPLAITSTGLTEGQDFSSHIVFHPVWTGGAATAKVEVYMGGTLRATALNGKWAQGMGAQVLPAENNTDVSLTVKVYDAAGNTAAASTTVHVDLTPPSATLNPAPGAPLGGVITVAATDVSADVAELALIDGAGKKLATATAAPWTITWNSVGGAPTAQARVTDRAGNQRTYQAWKFDNARPSISDLNGYFGTPLRRVRGVTHLGVEFSDASGINRNEWWIDGTLVQSIFHTGRYFDDVLTYDFGTTARTATVEVRAWDLAGNPATRTYSLVVDVTGPKITSVTPANGALVRGSRITSTVRATDPAGVNGANLNNGPWVSNPKNLTTATSAGADGRKTLTWRVFDALYNESTVTRTVIVDNTRPVLKLTKAPKSGAKVSGTVKVTASATDRNGVSRVELLINGKVVARDAKAGYGFSINTKKYGKKIRFQLRAYDRAGNAISTTTRTWHR